MYFALSLPDRVMGSATDKTMEAAILTIKIEISNSFRIITIYLEIMATKEYKQLARERHGRRYSYSDTYLASGHTQITVICRTHGAFLTLPGAHLIGSGCSKCHSDATLCKLMDYYMPSKM
jgi:hypothetical protein